MTFTFHDCHSSISTNTPLRITVPSIVLSFTHGLTQLLTLSTCGAEPASHTLKAASWSPVAVDLGHKGWSEDLAGQGFDPAVPTVWLAEGLLMYLQPPAVDAMLQEMAGAPMWCRIE